MSAGNVAKAVRKVLHTRHSGAAYEHRVQFSVGINALIVLVGIPLACSQVYQWKMKVRAFSGCFGYCLFLCDTDISTCDRWPRQTTIAVHIHTRQCSVGPASWS